MNQQLLDFSKVLTDADGDKITIDFHADVLQEIAHFLKCSKKRALQVYDVLHKDFEVYANYGQIVLAKGDKAIYNFESFGQTWWHGHKYNIVDEWDFRNFVEGKKIKTEKRKSTERKILYLLSQKYNENERNNYGMRTQSALILAIKIIKDFI